MSRIIVAVLALPAALGQDKPLQGSWNRVLSIKPGAAARVKTAGAKKPVSGKFAGASEDAIRIEGKGGVTSIPRTGVERVSVARRKKARNAAIGAAIGAGAGAGISAVSIANRKTTPFLNFTTLEIIGGSVAGALFGIPAGLVSGAGHTTVYSADVKPKRP